MCRNIKTLFNFDPPATKEEIRNASLQFVRKLTGVNKPSKFNEIVFNQAVEKISGDVENFLTKLQSSSPPRNREQELEKAKVRNQKRYGV